MDLAAKQEHWQKLSLSNTCDYCDRHLQAIHNDVSTVCARCLSDRDIKLRTCSGCTLRRYCSTECQKNDWPQHRQMCLSSQQQHELRKLHGPHIDARHAAFERFSKKSRGIFSFPAVWGMGIGTESDVSQSHILLIYVNVEEHITTTSKPEFRFLFREAHIMTESNIVSLFQSRYKKPIQFEAAQTNCVRIWLVDDGLPVGLDVTNCVVECVNMQAIRRQVWPDMQCDWPQMMSRCLAEGRELPPDEVVYCTQADDQRVVDNQKWLKKNGENILMVGLVAMGVQKNPKKLATECFVIKIDVQEETMPSPRFRRSVRHATVQTLEEIKKLYHYDLSGYGSGRHLMIQSLLVDPPRNSMRCIIVDNGLPFAKSIQLIAMAPEHFTHNYLKLSKRKVLGSDWLSSLKKLVDEK